MSRVIALSFVAGLFAGFGLALFIVATASATSRPAAQPVVPAASDAARGGQRTGAPSRAAIPAGGAASNTSSGAPPSLPAVPPVGPSPAATASPRPTAEPAPLGTPRAGSRPAASTPTTLRGVASWFAAPAGTAAAGPALRRLLGPSWRGTVVIVAANGSTVRVQLTDFCQCRVNGSERLIDLGDGAFARLAPLDAGLVRVTVTVR